MLMAAGCAAAAAGPSPGVSTAQPEPQSPTRPVLAPRAWKDFAAAQLWPEAAPAVVALGHRRDGTLVRVRVEPPANEAYRLLAAQSPMPEGARVIAFLETPSGSLRGASLLEKRAGSWLATELDAAGQIVPTDAGICLRCHAQAPTDGLFGLTQRAAPHNSP